MADNIRVGLIGTGFGRRVMLPVFAALESAEVVAVCSGHRENAETTAAQYSIAGVYTEYEQMFDSEELDLVLITSPPHLHLPMSRAALDREIHVLCEKPTALNLAEAQEIYRLAQDARVLSLIDHELRFLPIFRKMKELIAGGYLGSLDKVRFSIDWGFPMTFERDWNWWFDAERGGGLLGALGSHQVDLIRWMMGEFKAVQGELHISDKTRPINDTNEQREVTADDYAVILAQFESGAIGTIVLNSRVRAAGTGHFWKIAMHGDRGSLIWDDRRVLTGLPHDGDPEDFTQPPEVDDVPGLPDQVFPSGFAHFAPKIVAAIQAGQLEIPEAPTFYDGMRVQAVLDAVRESHQRGGWIDCSVS